MSKNTEGLTLGQLGEINAGLHAEVARLNEQVLALAALAEERREFIVNGVEFAYIRIPSVPLDKATGTYERCLLKPKFAAYASLNEVRAQGAEQAIEEAIDAMVRSGALWCALVRRHSVIALSR